MHYLGYCYDILLIYSINSHDHEKLPSTLRLMLPLMFFIPVKWDMIGLKNEDHIVLCVAKADGLTDTKDDIKLIKNNNNNNQ